MIRYFLIPDKPEGLPFKDNRAMENSEYVKPMRVDDERRQERVWGNNLPLRPYHEV